MKKHFGFYAAVLMILLVAVTITACSKGKEKDKEPASKPTLPPHKTEVTATPVPEPEDGTGENAVTDDGNSGPEDDTEDNAGTNGGSTIAEGMTASFNKYIAKNDDILAVMNKIYEDNPEFTCDIFEINEGYLSGFNTEITGFNGGVGMAPFIGTIPFVAYIFETDDPEALTALLNSSSDKAWNICTTADEYMTETVGRYVFAVFAPFE